MSDFEINKKVAELLGYTVVEVFSDHIGFTEKYHKDYPATVWAYIPDETPQEQLCFTGSWEDAGPLIEKYKICVKWLDDDRGWRAHSKCYQYQSDDKDPCRAAMLTLIKMEIKQ